MNVTKLLREFLIATCGMKDTATDDEARKAAADAMVTGKLTPAKYAELSAAPAAPAHAFAADLKTMNEGIAKLIELQTAKAAPPAAAPAEEATKTIVEKAAAGGSLGLTKALSNMGNDGGRAGEAATGTVRVKGAWEDYATTKSAASFPTFTKEGKPHPHAGKPLVNFAERGYAMDNPSEQEKAVAGAFGKLLVAQAKAGGSRSLGFAQLNQHDRELVLYAAEHYKWAGCGPNGDPNRDYEDISNRKLTPHEQKALIDDSTSGGIEAAPIVFDDMVIQTPLLNGELYPLVNTIPLDRGRRVEGVATLTVTSSWGGVDATNIALFDTTAYVSAFDTTVFRWEGSVRVGLDFLSDSPIDFGAHLTGQYGERLLSDLDNVIATGNGSTQPEGAMNKSGATSVAWGGSTSIGNYESLMFGFGKAERRPGLAASTVFCGTDTSYFRARAIPVGANDSRRLGGSLPNIGGIDSHLSWQWMGQPYKINNSLANTQVFYAILARYRMYRRRGLAMRTSTEGDTLIRANSMLMVVMARYGGQFERGAVVVKTTTAPA